MVLALVRGESALGARVVEFRLFESRLSLASGAKLDLRGRRARRHIAGALVLSSARYTCAKVSSAAGGQSLGRDNSLAL